MKRIAMILMICLTGCASKKNGLSHINSLALSDVVNHNLIEVLGGKVMKQPDVYFDPDLFPFLDQFLSDALARNVKIPIESSEALRQIKYVDQLSRPSAGVIASCNRYKMEKRQLDGSVKIIEWKVIEVLKEDSLAYTEGNSLRLKKLVYHELYHCLMNRGHLPSEMKGIMSAIYYKKGDQQLAQLWYQLVDDMFSTEFIEATPPVN